MFLKTIEESLRQHIHICIESFFRISHTYADLEEGCAAIGVLGHGCSRMQEQLYHVAVPTLTCIMQRSPGCAVIIVVEGRYDCEEHEGVLNCKYPHYHEPLHFVFLVDIVFVLLQH